MIGQKINKPTRWCAGFGRSPPIVSGTNPTISQWDRKKYDKEGKYSRVLSNTRYELAPFQRPLATVLLCGAIHTWRHMKVFIPPGASGSLPLRTSETRNSYFRRPTTAKCVFQMKLLALIMNMYVEYTSSFSVPSVRVRRLGSVSTPLSRSISNH